MNARQLPAITFTRHAPERGQGGAPEMLPAGCCCCCCCLHAIGGVAGAIVGSATQMRQRPVYESDPDSPFPYRRDVFEEDQPLVPPVLLYWLLVALAVAVTVAVTPFVAGGPGSSQLTEIVAVGLFVSVMILPALQLAASVVAVIVIAVFYPERGYAMRRIGRITIYWFGGAALGMLLMAGCWAVLTMR